MIPKCFFLRQSFFSIFHFEWNVIVDIGYIGRSKLPINGNSNKMLAISGQSDIIRKQNKLLMNAQK